VNLRGYLDSLRSQGRLTVVSREVKPELETAGVVHALDEAPIVFERVCGSRYPIVAGLCSRRDDLAAALGTTTSQMMFTLAKALRAPLDPPVTDRAPCQEIVEGQVDLHSLPVLTHLGGDGGAYITAGVVVVNDPQTGRNAAIHRLMVLDEHRLAARLVENRGTDTAWRRSSGDLEVAICIGNSPAVLIASAMSPAPGVDELAIAQALAATPLVRCRTVNVMAPADAEIVLEGRITHELVDEGPFLDLTETMDIVRPQPVIQIQCITHRRDAYYQALLPGGLEHRLLMGLPREPTIYEAVNRVCQCINVALTPGGGGWLHAVVQIRKQHPDDGLKAAEAAFRGHGSLKHVWVVDEDINIFDPTQVEWSVATRFQADHGLLVWPDEPGSSLDPSGRHVPGQKSRTAKLGLDATIPWHKPDGSLRTDVERASFLRVHYQTVEPRRYQEDSSKNG
jgi:2,5-furandicarboxylate decarboxylase 1